LEGTVVNAIISALASGGSDLVMSVGWLLYLLERYHFLPRREKEFREDVDAFREDYQELANKMSATLSSFSTILEVIKDRLGRLGS
jgi:hypothetical protein